MNLAIVFAVSAMVLWGLEEFFLKEALSGLRSVTTMLINTVAGGILSVIVVYAFMGGASFISAEAFLLATISAIAAFLGYFFFYKALERQELSLISALDESWIIIAIIIGVVAFSESLSLLHVLAIVAVILGAFLISAEFSKLKGLKFISGSGYEALAILFTGISVPLEKLLVGQIGEANSIIYLYALYFPMILISKVIMGEKLVRPEGKLLKAGIYSGLADGSAFAFYLFALNSSNISLVSPIVASNVVVALILAKIYLREKVTPKERWGIALVLLGVVTLSVFFG